MTLTEIETKLAGLQAELAGLQAEMAELRNQALRLPEVRSMPGAWVRGWLESHGASAKEAQAEILKVLNERRAASGQPPVGTCRGRSQ